MMFSEKRLSDFERVIPASTIDICVVIPAKNEADHLLITLQSLHDQENEINEKINFDSYEVLLLLNNCTDDSLKIAKEFQCAHPLFRLHIASVELSEDRANIGYVRRVLMEEAYRRFLYLGKNRGVIASIDGDTLADKCWLHHISEEIKAGNDAVGGLITIKETAGEAEQAYIQDINYRLLLTEVEQMLCPQVNDPLPRHFHFFGANMAVTAEYYYKSGGIPDVHYLEDMAFHTALLRCDAKIRRSLQVKVITSTRFNGRVAIGFSEQLRKWSDESQKNIPQVVEGTEIYIGSYFIKGQLQRIWNSKDNNFDQITLKNLTIALGLTEDLLLQKLVEHNFFGSFWEEVWHLSNFKNDIEGKYEPIQNAIKKLKLFIQNPDLRLFQINLFDIFHSGDLTNV